MTRILNARPGVRLELGLQPAAVLRAGTRCLKGGQASDGLKNGCFTVVAVVMVARVGDCLCRDEAKGFQCGASGLESPEVDHEQAGAGDDGFLSLPAATLHAGAEHGGEFGESPPAGVPLFEPPDGFHEHPVHSEQGSVVAVEEGCDAVVQDVGHARAPAFAPDGFEGIHDA